MRDLDKVSTHFVDFSDIQSSAGSTFALTSSLARSVFRVQYFDTTGEFIGVYVGAVGSEVLEFIVGPGANMETPATLPVGSRVSIRSMGAAPTAGKLALNLLG